MLSLERQNELREAYRQSHPGWRPATEVYADWVRAEIKAGSRLLDLGCGRGGLVEQLDQPTEHVIGIDPDYLALQEHRLARIERPMARANGVGVCLPFASGCFDVVFASWVLEHMAEPALDFGEIGRVLRPGGAFVFITPNKRHPLMGLNRFTNRLGGLQDRLVARLYGREAADTYPAHYLANSPEQIEALAREAGMSLAKIEAIPDPTYLALRPGLFRLVSGMEERLPASRAIHLVGVLERL